MESVQVTNEVPTIKDQLLARFVVARDKLGRGWRKQLAESNPEFDTLEGANDMKLITEALNSKKRRGQVDRIKKIVLALEDLAGIPHPPIL